MRRSEAACNAVSYVTAHAAAVQQRDFSLDFAELLSRRMHLAITTLRQRPLLRALVLVVFCRCMSCSSSYSRYLDIQVFHAIADRERHPPLVRARFSGRLSGNVQAFDPSTAASACVVRALLFLSALLTAVSVIMITNPVNWHFRTVVLE